MLKRAVFVFLVASFGFSWGIAALHALWSAAPPWTAGAMAVLFMWGPAIGAVAAVKWGLGEPIAALGPFWRWNRWLAVAWLAPLGFVVLATLASASLPGVALNLGAAELTARILAAMPKSATEAQLVALGSWLPLVIALQLVGNALIGGPSVSALVAFGEELGWRGFLQRLLPVLGFWRGSLAIGCVWGLWHAPLILRGLNYPQHPRLGVLLMVVFCALLAPLFAHVRERAGSLLAACVLHGTLNASGGVLLFVGAGSDLLVGPTGLVGMAVLAALDLLLWHRRRSASEPVRDEVADYPEVRSERARARERLARAPRR